jgi:hypothetical protein
MGWLSLHIGLSSSDGIPGWPMATLMMMSGLLRCQSALNIDPLSASKIDPVG